MAVDLTSERCIENYMPLRIDTPVQFLKGVGPKFGDLLRKKGIATIGDLLQWYPRAYEDRRVARNIASLKADELVSLKAQIVNVSSFQLGKSRRKIYDITVRDDSGKIHCKFFRVPYKGYFERYQPQQFVRVIGKVTFYRGRLEFHHPDLQDLSNVGSSLPASGSLNEKALQQGASDKIQTTKIQTIRTQSTGPRSPRTQGTGGQATSAQVTGTPSPEVQSEADQDVVLPIYAETEGLTTRQIQKWMKAALIELKASGYADPEAAFRASDSVAASQRRGSSKRADGLYRTPEGILVGKPGQVPFIGSTGRVIGGMAGLSPSIATDFSATQKDAQNLATNAAGFVALNVAGFGPEPLEKFPPALRQKWQLPDRYSALLNVHVPPSDAGPEWCQSRSPFHRRLIFEEFFWLELYLAARRAGIQKEKAPALAPTLNLVEQLKKNLPFALTKAQERAFSEIIHDLKRPHPMHRLVQGDVGSGKTLVALMAALVAVANKSQAVIMVPTEILAEQHYKSAVRYLEPLGVTVGCLTGSMKQSERTQTLDLLKTGLINVVVGTHALIEDAVVFQNLSLVIIDEQHRFGVHQRSRLKQKGGSPHFLVMTATPIPRTLAMTVYGDLEVSVIDEMPPGRSPIVTRAGFESVRPKMLSFLKEQVAKGRQAYVVYPLVEESEKLDLKDAVSAYETLSVELAQWKVGLLHGKMKASEKDEVMTRFRSGEINVLVSTTVIEVGVDVPNATLIVIEHAERFGLSQLHQLRGRVGRGQHKSFCILMLGHAVGEDGRKRSEIMEGTNDGFKIAEADLELRGPGEFLGSRQSGLPGFRLANLIRDVQILQDARAAAFELLDQDPRLARKENRPLRDELLRTHGATALASVG